MLVDELVQVEQVLQQLPGSAEGRRDQLDQRLGIVGGDVFVGERRAEGARMRRLRDTPVGRHAQRLLFDALAAALDDFGLAAIDQRRQGLFELAVDGGTHAGRASCRLPPEMRNQSMGESDAEWRRCLARRVCSASQRCRSWVNICGNSRRKVERASQLGTKPGGSM